jgi:hypothetical protein
VGTNGIIGCKFLSKKEAPDDGRTHLLHQGGIPRAAL